MYIPSTQLHIKYNISATCFDLWQSSSGWSKNRLTLYRFYSLFICDPICFTPYNSVRKLIYSDIVRNINHVVSAVFWPLFFHFATLCRGCVLSIVSFNCIPVCLCSWYWCGLRLIFSVIHTESSSQLSSPNIIRVIKVTTRWVSKSHRPYLKKNKSSYVTLIGLHKFSHLRLAYWFDSDLLALHLSNIYADARWKQL